MRSRQALISVAGFDGEGGSNRGSVAAAAVTVTAPAEESSSLTSLEDIEIDVFWVFRINCYKSRLPQTCHVCSGAGVGRLASGGGLLCI